MKKLNKLKDEQFFIETVRICCGTTGFVNPFVQHVPDTGKIHEARTFNGNHTDLM